MSRSKFVTASLVRQNTAAVKRIWPNLTPSEVRILVDISCRWGLSVSEGDMIVLEGKWYVTHSTLLRIARAQGCYGIVSSPVQTLCNETNRFWVFEATVFTTRSCRGFTGFGDADPQSVSPAMHGAELRIAETRAVNRALRKAYGIGLCSVEELGSAPVPPSNGNANRAPARLGANFEVITPVPLRDQLRQLVRQHRLDPVLTKSYALDHLRVKSLRDATREQVSELIAHLQKRLFEDRDQFLAELAKCTASKEQKEVA